MLYLHSPFIMSNNRAELISLTLLDLDLASFRSFHHKLVASVTPSPINI